METACQQSTSGSRSDAEAVQDNTGMEVSPRAANVASYM